MSRARRWSIAIGLMLLSGCASSSDSSTSTAEDVFWVFLYLAAIVAGVVGAKLLVESHQKD